MGGAGAAVAGGLASGAMSSMMGGAAGGGGGMEVQPFEKGYFPGWEEEADEAKRLWEKQYAGELERAEEREPVQKERMQAILRAIFDQGSPLYDPMAREEEYVAHRNRLQQMLNGLLMREEDPYFKSRVDEAEKDRLRDTAKALKRLMNAEEHAIARGGSGMINPERRDEMVASVLADAGDVSRQRAREEIEGSLLNIFQRDMAMSPIYKDVAGQERAREIAGLGFYGQSMMGQEEAQLGYENAIGDILNKWEQREPNKYQFRVPYTSGGGMVGQPNMSNTAGGGPMAQIPGLIGQGVSSLWGQYGPGGTYQMTPFGSQVRGDAYLPGAISGGAVPSGYSFGGGGSPMGGSMPSFGSGGGFFGL